jgi:hypothetical protein
VWNGHSGALTAKAKKNPPNSAFSRPGSMFSWLASVWKSNVGSPNWRAERKNKPITAASISRPPNRL